MRGSFFIIFRRLPISVYICNCLAWLIDRYKLVLTNSHVSKIVVWSWSKGCLKGYEQQCKGGHENLQQMDELHLEVSVKAKLANTNPHPLNTYYQFITISRELRCHNYSSLYLEFLRNISIAWHNIQVTSLTFMIIHYTATHETLLNLPFLNRYNGFNWDGIKMSMQFLTIFCTLVESR